MGKKNKHITESTFYEEQLIVRQFSEGYRFSIDSVLLAHFPTIRRNERILDLGTGCGIIGLILSYRNVSLNIEITGIEKQSNLAELAQQNSYLNNYQNNFGILQGDIKNIRELCKPESATMVISNPPFYSAGSGRLSKSSEKKTARHQVDTTIEDFVSAASFCVKNRGRVVMIFPAEFMMHLLLSYNANGLEIKNLQFIYSYPTNNSKAKLVMVEGVKNGGKGMVVMEPCYIYQYAQGPYSEKIKMMYLPHSRGETW